MDYRFTRLRFPVQYGGVTTSCFEDVHAIARTQDVFMRDAADSMVAINTVVKDMELGR